VNTPASTDAERARLLRHGFALAPDAIRRHWPGTPAGLTAILRLAGTTQVDAGWG
jgi:hypothetical protein